MSSLVREMVLFIAMLIGFTITCLTFTGLLILIGVGLSHLGGIGLLVATGVVVSCVFVYFLLKGCYE